MLKSLAIFLVLFLLSGCAQLRGLFSRGEEGAALKDVFCSYASTECPKIMLGSPAGKVLCERALKECSLPATTAAGIRSAAVK